MALQAKGPTSWRLLAVLLLLTAAHAVYRWLLLDAGGVEAVIVSGLATGAVVPTIQVEVATQSGWTEGPLLEPHACQLLIAFDPACPYCMRAAEGEATLEPDRRLPTTWVTNRDASNAMRYRERLGTAGRVVRSDQVIEALDVKGVPAAFLVGPEGAVRRVWAYKGVETRAELEPSCGRLSSAP